MRSIARILVAVGLVGCSVAARDAVTIVDGEGVDRSWTTRDRGVFAAASPSLSFEWRDGRVAIVQREVVARRPGHARPGAKPAPPAPITLETVTLGRESSLVRAAGTATRRADGALVVDRGLAVERLEQRRAGLSQSWKFASKPSGLGDLVVRLNVAGIDTARADAKGILLSAGEHKYRYGTATWIDATGTSRAVPVAVVDGQIEIRVPAGVLDASAFPATLDPIVSAESYGPPRAATPRVAGAGQDYVAVWQDYSTTPPRVASARIDAATGKIQTPFAVPVSAASTAVASQPAIAAAGDGYLVAYHEEGASDAIRGRWLDASGAPTGADFVIGGTTEAASWPAVACGDTRCLVAWQEFASGVPQVRAAFVAKRASASDGVIFVTSSANTESIPDVATDGTHFAVTWSESRDDGDAIMAAVLGGADFSAVDVETTATWYRSSPRIAFAAGSFFVTYADARSIATIDVFAKRLDAATGAPVDANAIAVATSDADEDYPVVGSDGTNAVIVFADADAVRDAVVAPNGAVVGAATLDVQPYAMPEALGTSSTGLFAAWSGADGAYANRLFGARLRGDDGAALDTTPIVLSDGPGRCGDVTVAASPSEASPAGTPVTFTASSTCVDATPEFQFWVETPGVGFQLLRDFDADGAATWTTTQLPTDSYRVVVRSRRAGLFDDWESEAELYHGVVGDRGTCSQIAAQASADTVSSGASVDIAATATCTADEAPEYQFLIALPNGVSWVARDWGTSAFAWDTSGFPSSTPSLVVRSRRVGSSAAFESETTVETMVVNGRGMCGIASLSTSAAVIAGGDSVTLTAQATCAGDEAAEYEFIVRPPSGSTRVFRSYGASPTATFTADGVSGAHHFWVRTRRAGSALPLEGRAAATVYVQ